MKLDQFNSPFDFFENVRQICPVCGKQLQSYIDCYSAYNDITYSINKNSMYFYSKTGPKYMIDKNLNFFIKNENKYELFSNEDKITFDSIYWYIGKYCKDSIIISKKYNDTEYLLASRSLLSNNDFSVDYEMIKNNNYYIFNKFIDNELSTTFGTQILIKQLKD